MKFKLEIECDNAAFEDDPGAEIARILQWVANDVAQGVMIETRTLRDINGNTVGSYTYEDDEPDSRVRQTTCRHCGHDIEGFLDEDPVDWRDRGNNRHCPPAEGLVSDTRHEPVED